MSIAPPDGARTGPPAPSPEARAHSDRVLAHIAAMIEAAGGWIAFPDYMGAALYAPGLGYYAAGARKFGAAGDFVTAPEISPLFGRTLAVQVADALRRIPGGDVIELGPGSGRLAADMLSALAERDALPARYLLLEVSPDLRERQREHLRSSVPELLPRLEWIGVLPERWRGTIVANEVLDALPPHLVWRGGGAWFERGVALDAERRLAFADRPLQAGALRDAAKARFPQTGDYLSEVNPAAMALVRSLAQRCEQGALIVIDYGFPASEYYHPQRTSGTLIAHYRHHVLVDPFFLPGLTDLTAHVDFSAVAQAAVAGGMTMGGFTTQERFLVNCGVLDELARCGDPQSTRYLRAAAAALKLLSPTEMGELFKAIAFTRGIDGGLVGFRVGDQSHRL